MTTSPFDHMPDAFVLEQVQTTFGHLTGATRPVPKKKGMTKVDGNDLETHFQGGMSFMSMAQFWHAFPVAVRRGLLSPVEIAMGQEVMDLLDGK